MAVYDLSYLGTSHVVPATWPYDKYPDMPELKAKSEITLLDTDGPGIVSCIHASHYLVDSGMGDNVYEKSAPLAASVLLKVYYDNDDRAAIAMPFFDFLGDLDCRCGFYATKWFSKVPMSHNFRLPMPFTRHIRMTLENPTDCDLMGYADVQYEQINLPGWCGYLCVQCCNETVRIPGEPFCIGSVQGRARIAAHWLQLEGRAPGFENGEGLCEANCEFYLDGERTPSCNYLGTEDLYGFSWGFRELHSDGWSAILRRESLNPGARIAVLRCRETDAISFLYDCRVMMDYRCRRR